MWLTCGLLAPYFFYSLNCFTFAARNTADMDTNTEIQELKVKVDGLIKTTDAMRDVIQNLVSAVVEGFDTVNERLAKLEGKDGMQGVHSRLGEIKNELSKIHKVVPYEDFASNMDIIKGEA